MTLNKLQRLSARLGGSAASLTGRRHLQTRRNNQDAYAVVALDGGAGGVLAVVADGCSSAPRSELGAALAVRWIGARAARWVGLEGAPADALVEALTADLLRYLEGVAAGLAGAPPVPDAVWQDAVHDTLLCSLVVAAVGPSQTRVFAIGDGLVGVDETLTVLDPGPDNAPDYLAYRLLGLAGAGAPQLLVDQPTVSFDGLLIGTDGAADLGADTLTDLIADRSLTARPAALTRRLRRLEAAHGGPTLGDDTTLALIHRTRRAS